MQNKILVLANSSGGLFNFRGKLLEELLKNHEVVVYTPNNGKILELESIGCKIFEINVDRRGINPVKDFKLLMMYRKIIKSINPDLVITYTIKPNIYGGVACRLSKVPYVVNITGLGTAFQKKNLLRTVVTCMYKFALKKATTVFFENAENQQIFIDEKIVPADKTCLLNGAGVNLEYFSYRDYPLNNNPTRFLFVGRVMKEKGIDELFDAMRKLRSAGFECTLDVVGSYEENYADIVKSGEVEGWLNYHGHQSDVRPFIENAHCFVLPSWHEGMANTNLECAAMGRPLITSNIHGCKEAVLDGQSGFLCEVKNAESLYLKMKEFMSLSNEERSQMGKAGRQHMENVFNKKLVVEETIRNMF